MDYDEMIDEIKKLPKNRAVTCDGCTHTFQVALQTIDTTCPVCGNRQKCRGWGSIGTEIEDVLDAVEAWQKKPDPS